MKRIATDQAPTPAGHYAQGIVEGGWLFVSGQLPIDHTSGQPRLGSVEEQTQLALRNVGAIVQAAGSRLSRIVKTTVYVTDIELWPRVNAAYASFFGEHRPARAVVPVKELHHGALVEIEAIASVGS